MKVSLNWIKQYTNIDLPTSKLIEKINSQLGAIEEVIDLGERYRNILVVNVVECNPIEGSDHLNLCRVDDGRVNKNVQRDSGGYVQVVCGANNVKAGVLAVWIPPGSQVPSSFGKESFVMEAKELKGIVSNGMLASSRELSISDEHDGILLVDEIVKPGTDFASVYGLDDVIFDIENKMLTHRPDCFGQLGIAREISGILGQPFRSPSWYLKTAPLNQTSEQGMNLFVKNEIPKQVPHFMAQVISDIDVRPSRIKLQTYLSRIGIRPINNIVDITNYIMMLTGQPIHAYDYDKVKAIDSGANQATLVIRNPARDETLALLNGKTVKPSSDAILIATNTKAIGLAGIMGGSETEVGSETKNIIIECATFDMNLIRKTAMEVGVFSEAVTRFTKGQSPNQNEQILAKCVSEMVAASGGKVAGLPIDNRNIPEDYNNLSVDIEFINSRLGLSLSIEAVSKMLTNVEIGVGVFDKKLTIDPPFWRMDLHIPEDIVEEAGRLYGYDNLKIELPKREISSVKSNPLMDLKRRLRHLLARAGANEVLTYNFVHGDLLDKVGQERGKAYQLANAISPELQYLRLSLLPSLLEKVHPNIKSGFHEFAIFEMNKSHIKGNSDHEDLMLPAEENRLALVYAGEDKTVAERYVGAPYYQALNYLAFVFNEIGLEIKTRAFADLDITELSLAEQAKPFERVRSSLVFVGDICVGIIGEPTPRIKRLLKLPKFTSMFEVDLSSISGAFKQTPYIRLSSYPSVEQDVCFKVDASLAYYQLAELIIEELEQLIEFWSDFKVIDIFQKKDDPAHRQITFHIKLSSYKKTLTSAEANQIIAKLGAAVKSKFGGEII